MTKKRTQELPKVAKCAVIGEHQNVPTGAVIGEHQNVPTFVITNNR